MHKRASPEIHSRLTSNRRRHFTIAVVTGMSIAIACLGLNLYMNPDHYPALSDALFTAQYPGWLLCAGLTRGSFESSNTTNYLATAVPVNSILYASITFAALRLCYRKA